MTKIAWLGRSTFHLDPENGPAILIDPWLNGSPSYPRGYSLDDVELAMLPIGDLFTIGPRQAALASEFL